MSVAGFDSYKDMMEAEAAAQKEAAGQVTDKQRAIKPGDYYIILTEHGFAVFGEVLPFPEPEFPCEGTMNDGCKDCDDYEDCLSLVVDDFYKSDAGQYYRFCRAFSLGCVDGEMGDAHISQMIPISKDVFDEAKVNDWVII